MLITLVTLASYVAMVLYTDEDSMFSISMMVLGFVAVTQLMMIS